MSLVGPRFTVADYMLLPDDNRHEIIEGELLVAPAPNVRHQRILVRLVARLAPLVEAGGLGDLLPAPTDVILSDQNVVQPDLLFVATDRLEIVDPKGAVHGAPDLVVEILSPSTVARDQVAKRMLYGKYGVREYWIVDPEARSIEVLEQCATGLETWCVCPSGTTLTSQVLPGLSLAVADLLPE